MEIFAKRLKELREATGLTQNKLAKKLLISQITVTSYENGYRFPRIDILVAIANFFKVSSDYLLGLSDRKERV